MFGPRTFSSALALLTVGLLACSSPRNDLPDDDWGSVEPGKRAGVTITSVDGNDGHQRWTTVLPKGRLGNLTLDRNGDVVFMEFVGGQTVDFGADPFSAFSAFGRFSSATGKYLSGSGYSHAFSSVARHASGDLIVGFSDQLVRLALP
jgi:hypothetical protein